VLQAAFRGRVEGEGLLALASGGTAGVGGGGLSPVQVTDSSGVPIALDIRILTPAAVTFIESSAGSIDGRANLQVSGTIDRPVLTGEVEIERGEYTYGSNRYRVRRGTIEFLNRTRIDPVFDVELETRPRSGSQVFTVNLRLTGTFSKFALTADSDPYLTQTEILSLLAGAPTDVTTATERQLRSPQAAQEQLVQLVAAQLIASPITSRVGSVFERFPIDTVQVTPLLFDAESGQRLNPSARVTLGKRISSKVYLTYSRTVGGGGINSEEIVLIEYEQSDRISWVLSRNEDRTFALDFRVRYIF
jgi:autotransporter translocation and assembly factor TamB